MKQLQQEYYTRRGWEHQQLMLPIETEIRIPEDDPVRLASAELEELDYRKLYRAYSSRGRKYAADPRVMFKVMAYGYMNGIYSSRKLEKACRKNIDFMWLLEGERVPDHNTFARFRTGRLEEAVEDLFYQHARRLNRIGETDYETGFIDGTKFESLANQYTFVWRKSVEKHLAKVKQRVGEGLGQVGAAESATLQTLESWLEKAKEGIQFVHGSGKRQTQEQRQWELLDGLLRKWKDYENKLSIMGQERNSYSKTDPDATFMRMKEDHMLNGQLKPGYNVQIAVNSEYITGVAAFANRNDNGTLIPFLKKLQHGHGQKYQRIVADAGYESQENYLYLDAQGQMSFIKPANYEYRNSKKFKEKIGRQENMTYDEADDSYLCANQQRLTLCRETSQVTTEGYVKTTAYYGCSSCATCPLKEKCFQSKHHENKLLKVKRDLIELRKVSLANITEPDGIKLRVNRSIQVEGAFGVLKQDRQFKRFLTRGKHNISIELYLLCLAFNLNKLYAKATSNRLKTHLFEKLIS